MTMVLSLPSLVNVGSLLALVVYMYSILGVQLFTFVRHQSYLTQYRNFDSFGNAVTLLFQCLTGDGWSYLMFDCMATEEDQRGCTLEGGDCGGWHAIPYFVSFQVGSRRGPRWDLGGIWVGSRRGTRSDPGGI